MNVYLVETNGYAGDVDFYVIVAESKESAAKLANDSKINGSIKNNEITSITKVYIDGEPRIVEMRYSCC